MINSMTGYGRAICNLPTKDINIELRSLNSKQQDINIKLPNSYKVFENEIRTEIINKLKRGKIECSIFIDNKGEQSNFKINKEVVNSYFSQLKEISNQSFEIGELSLTSILRLPDVLIPPSNEQIEIEWKSIKKDFLKAIHNLQEFRNQEGKAIEEDLKFRISEISNSITQLSKFESDRVNNIRNRIYSNLKENLQSGDVDENRFEQEIIYYLEKLDITEEKNRLKNHCEYFLKSLETEDSVGKKLGFISQEIGREINTLGAKANHFEIQKIVIRMKDELEKIKEQLLNVL